MSDGYEVFKFKRVPRFHLDMNRDGCFDIEEMLPTNMYYEMVFASYCEPDINSNLNDDGTLNSNVKRFNIFDGEADLSLVYKEDSYGHFTISVNPNQNSISVDFGDLVSGVLKALFIIDKNTGYCLAYSILDRDVVVSNQCIFPIDGVIWNITQEVK